MALIDPVKKACNRLAGRGWAALLARHGLDIGKADLTKELARPLEIDRTIPGFEDLSMECTRGIQPGLPAASLLYHAFARVDVHPTADGEPAASNDSYPTLEELDAVENYIYGLAPLEKSDLTDDHVVAVFAYQYRPAASTAHGYHADLVFSRTGISRTGTGPAVWNGPCRGFDATPEGRGDIAVSPARYGAFIARIDKRIEASDPIMGRRDEEQDRNRAFLFPVHKLFAGSDCMTGLNIKLDFQEFHRTDKLRRIHRHGGIKVVKGFDVNAAPFVRDSTNGGNLVKMSRAGASIIIAPVHHDTLVRTVKQKNAVSGKSEIVRFVVPDSTKHERFETSLGIAAQDDNSRRAPEYVNIRHRVVPKGAGYAIEDMQSLPEAQFDALVENGGYEAAHFADDCCDGAVVVKVTGLPGGLRNYAAYSLVSAPDFFPLSDQLEITNWVRQNLQKVQEHFKQGAPWPLCEGRQPANLELPRPDAPNKKAFDRKDETVTAIVGTKPNSIATHAPRRRKRFASFLPDAASNVFAPGWDVSLGGDDKGTYCASYGLGSPFPEDAKLCAAINSFWPAVAPDASRTFRFSGSPTAIPMLDREIGYHPGHPLVKAGKVASGPGWDGEHGPFLELDAGKEFVNYASIGRSDYVSNALRNEITIRLTSGVESNELVQRMEALRRCVKALPPGNDRVSKTPLWLVSAEAIDNWATNPSSVNPKLTDAGYAYTFVTVKLAGQTHGDLRRLRVPVEQKFDCQISPSALFWRQDGGPWQEALV
jgi:hypothetical protein